MAETDEYCPVCGSMPLKMNDNTCSECTIILQVGAVKPDFGYYHRLLKLAKENPEGDFYARYVKCCIKSELAHGDYANIEILHEVESLIQMQETHHQVKNFDSE